MNQEIDHEEFLTEEDFKNGENISIEDLEKINGHPTGENFLIQENEVSGRFDFLDNDSFPVGVTPSGLPLYRGEDPGEMYKPKMEEIHKIENKNLNKDFLAFIDEKSIEIIKNFLGTEISSSELAKKIVAFKSGTEIFYDKNDPTIHLRNSIFAIKNNSLLDKSDCPAEGLYVNLANLTEKIAKRRYATVNDSNFNHIVNFPRGRAFFASPKDAIQVKVSIKNENGIIERH